MKRSGPRSVPQLPRIGLLGGTFNPIHLGHLHVAERVQALFELSQVLLVVSTTPPHKSSEHLVHFTHRYAMVSLATAGLPALVPSMAELSPPPSPFSFDTLSKVARAWQGNAQIYFIAGSDSILEICTWHRSDELLANHDFIFISRPGVKLKEPGAALPAAVRARMCDLRGLGTRAIVRRIHQDSAEAARSIYLADVAAPNISASMIRERVRQGKRIQHLVPPLVCDYMQKLNLYGGL